MAISFHNIFIPFVLSIFMNVDTVIKKRHSVRKFTSKKPNYRDVFRAIEAAVKAPIAGNIPTVRYVLVNDEKVIVNQLDGETGTVTLAQIPYADDVVKINYFINRSDTLVEDENLSDQVDGTATTFKVHNPKIVDGTNNGTATTNPDDITVRVGDDELTAIPVEVESVDGNNATFTLVTAPMASSRKRSLHRYRIRDIYSPLWALHPTDTTEIALLFVSHLVYSFFRSNFSDPNTTKIDRSLY